MIPQELRSQVIQQFEQGKQYREISKELGVSLGSVANILRDHKTGTQVNYEHKQLSQCPINQQFIKSQSEETSSIIGTMSKDAFGSPSFKNGDGLATNFPGVSEEVDFSDNPYAISDEFLNDIYYSEEFDGLQGERLLHYTSEGQAQISVPSYNNNYVTEVTQIKETPEEPHQPRSSTSDIENKSVGLLDWDSEENYQSRFIRRVLQEKKNIKIEKDTLQLHWRRFFDEKKLLERREKELSEAEADLAQRISQVKDLISPAAALKQMGFNFSLANSWITCVSQMAQSKGLDMRSAAWELAKELENWQLYCNLQKTIQQQKQQLSLLNMTLEDQKAAIATLVNLQKMGMSEIEISRLVKLVNGWGKRNGLELDSRLNLQNTPQ